MNELTSIDEGIELAIETTKQHYFTLHSSMREEIIRLLEASENLNMLISMSGDDTFIEVPAKKRQPTSKEMKKIYSRICNLCHPDKTKKHDPLLISLMNEAKEAMRANDSFLLYNLYDRVRSYLDDPNSYNKIVTMAKAKLEKAANPWYKVHEFHVSGDTKSAYMESSKLLGYRIYELRLELNAMKEAARSKGIQI